MIQLIIWTDNSSEKTSQETNWFNKLLKSELSICDRIWRVYYILIYKSVYAKPKLLYTCISYLRKKN